MEHRLITIPQTAVAIGMSPVTVTHWAYRRRPAPADFPNPVHVGRQVRYVAAELDAWIASLRAESLSKAAARPQRRRGRPRKVSPPAKTREARDKGPQQPRETIDTSCAGA